MSSNSVTLKHRGVLQGAGHLSTGDTLLQALDLLPLLVQTVEKAASQSTQVPTVTEGVAAALLLSKLSIADSQAGKSRDVQDGSRQGPLSEALGGVS